MRKKKLFRCVHKKLLYCPFFSCVSFLATSSFMLAQHCCHHWKMTMLSIKNSRMKYVRMKDLVSIEAVVLYWWGSETNLVSKELRRIKLALWEDYKALSLCQTFLSKLSEYKKILPSTMTGSDEHFPYDNRWWSTNPIWFYNQVKNIKHLS